MVEGETSRIGERSTETISGDTSSGRRDLSNRYSVLVIGGQKIDVEKFDGKINFGMWRREVMDALIQIDLDIVLKNKRYLYDEEIWNLKDEECAVTLWRTLEGKYLVKSPENRLHAMSQVYGFRMKPGVSMHDHVSIFEKLLAYLKNLDQDIKDEVKAMILLHSLPKEYSHFVTTLIYEKSVIAFKDVCTVLTSLEIQNNDKNSERASSEALVSRDWAMEKQKKRGGKNSQSKSRSRNIPRDKCAFCHEKCHWRKDYPNAQKRDGKKSEAANMARKDEDSNYSLSITLAAYAASSSEWILDTRATYHLCPIKEWFTDFRNLESGAIVMGNDQPCRTMGIGTIRLKMFDGMVRELREVRYVPALKKNLISVGALEVKGYKVTIEDGIMKFTHGAMVILQGVRRHNLYYLKGGTTDEANIVEAHSDTTKLWHVRLGHAGEKSLQTLMRHELLKVMYGGPTKTASISGSHYFVTFVDDFSRRVWVYTMRANDESGKHAQDYDSLRIFGCPAYYHVKDGKLDPRARRAIFVGFKGGGKCFKLWDLEDKKFLCSRDVTFDEALMMKTSSSQQVENKNKEVLQQVEFDATPYVPVSSTSKKSSTMEVTPKVEKEVVSSDVPQNEETIDDVDNDDFIATRRPRREIKKPGWLTKDMVVAYALPVIDDNIPNTFGEALRRSESDQWKLAMEEEIKSLHQNQTWELVKLPKGKRAIDNKWVHTKKQGSPNQTTPRYKARLIAKGFAQNEDIGYNEVFSPVVKYTSIHILLALVAEYELELPQLDVKRAFLHGDLEEEIYMIQPCVF
ncbi:retrovirus-related pol polyprotein from transposon TNT 1-94-like protein [Citrus sinensis]|nr:retrovirus-related pol polyprotein from transposon TNT 1-94-like protein [Citrus sinensis]